MKTHPRHDDEAGTASTAAGRGLLSQGMSMDDKIGQMSQIDISMLLQTTTGEQQHDSGRQILNTTAVEEWIGQKGVGSVLNLVVDHAHFWTAADYRQAALQIQQVAAQHGRPPVIWGLDSVHGANYLHGAIVTPQPINLAATFNTTVAYAAGKLASRDTRAAGMNWLFSPLLGIALESRWSRVYETFGEDPVVVGHMAQAMIRGIQEPDNDHAIPSRAAACAKHFVGYSMPHNGHDRSPSWIPTRHLYQYFVPPWKRVLGEVKTVMEDYTETDGVPNVANPAALNYLLRERLQFRGVLVTDYAEIRNLYQWHHAVGSAEQADQESLRHGSVDMSMIPNDFDGFRRSILDGLQSHRLSPERITVSAERVLQLKQDLHMMDETLQMDDPNLVLVGTDEAAGVDMVRQSIVLTKNDQNVLPLHVLSTTTKRLKVLVTGPTSDSLSYQSGGWTGRWQGVKMAQEKDWFTYGSSLLGAFSAEASLDVSYRCGVDILGQDCGGDSNDNDTMWDHAVHDIKDWVGLNESDVPVSIQNAVEVAASADVVVIAVGEETNAEKPGDIRSLDLPAGQYQLVQHIQQNTKAKIILVYFGGRPKLLHDMVQQSDAVFVAFLPGPSAGEAIVDMVMGRVNPNGRLPLTYPMYDDGAGVPYFHAVSDQCTRGEGALPHWEYIPCEVQWPFGHGLSYTTFEYSDFTATGGIDQDLELSVVVRNTGNMGGAEVVMFFTFDEFRSTTPEYKRLRAFDKVYLEPGGEAHVKKTVPLDELRFVGPNDDTHYILDPKMKVWVGLGASTDCRVNPADNKSCMHLQSDNPSQEYIGACEAACDLWGSSGCNRLSKDACLPMCTAIARFPASPEDDGNNGWGWNYVRCLESVLEGISTEQGSSQEVECWKMTSLCRDIFQTGRLDEHGKGPYDAVPGTSTTLVPFSNFVALLVGLVATAIIVNLMNGGFFWKRRHSPETEFAVINTEEDME